MVPPDAARDPLSGTPEGCGDHERRRQGEQAAVGVSGHAWAPSRKSHMRPGDVGSSRCHCSVFGALTLLRVRGYISAWMEEGGGTDVGVDIEQLLLLTERNWGGHSVRSHRGPGTS